MQSYVDIVKYADLLARLAHDDDFRARFEADPRTVLNQELGIDLDPGDAPVKLPDKKTLQDEYQKRLESVAKGATHPLSLYS